MVSLLCPHTQFDRFANETFNSRTLYSWDRSKSVVLAVLKCWQVLERRLPLLRRISEIGIQETIRRYTYRDEVDEKVVAMFRYSTPMKIHLTMSSHLRT